MIRNLTAIAALPLAALATPVVAQEIAIEPSETESIERLADTLSDPGQQEALATSLAVVTEILLDLPLAPLLQPLAEATADVTGEPVRRVDPDATLRKIAPGAGQVSAQIQDKLPRAMDGMASMTGAVARMVPTLRDMARRMKEALPEDLGARD